MHVALSALLALSAPTSTRDWNPSKQNDTENKDVLASSCKFILTTFRNHLSFYRRCYVNG